MEDDMCIRFWEDPLRGYMTRPIQKSTMALWRKCCHLAVFPTDIIGPKHYMEYGTDVVIRESKHRINSSLLLKHLDHRLGRHHLHPANAAHPGTSVQNFVSQEPGCCEPGARSEDVS
ncbi:hypothetical protein F4801DRAFT_602289 [Xylaria longipes]|nr:hypothetical protein F4801DRAFT_602289 [Xylaria longipes]